MAVSDFKQADEEWTPEKRPIYSNISSGGYLRRAFFFFFLFQLLFTTLCQSLPILVIGLLLSSTLVHYFPHDLKPATQLPGQARPSEENGPLH